MIRRAHILVLFFCFFVSAPCWALLSMELTRGVPGAIPIAITPFAFNHEEAKVLSTIITNDLQNSGAFKVSSAPELAIQRGEYFKKLGVNYGVAGQLKPLGQDQYQVSFELYDVFSQQGAATVLLAKQYKVSKARLRALAHRISDQVYQAITGTRGIFSTKIAYVLVERRAGAATRYVLEVADQDGYNPRPLLSSSEPIMSPAWSPDGRFIAYVSFEKRHASIYLEEVATGQRRLLTEFPGINGAPAFSPDGKKLALVLSKTGAPNIYVMDIANRHLTQITNDFYINTEPAWSPDGRSLLFTSNRSGHPQIYQIQLGSKNSSRITFSGDYNARGSFSPQAQEVVMIHRVSGIYHIAVQDLDNGTTRIISGAAADSISPSFAPNGRMVLFDTRYQGRNVLAMASIDGRVQLRLPASLHEVRDAVWSPFLN